MYLNRQNPIVKCEKLIFIRLYLGKNENKSHFILFFAGFFVPLRMDSA